jgi:hypothetical protein
MTQKNELVSYKIVKVVCCVFKILAKVKISPQNYVLGLPFFTKILIDK